MNMIRLIKKVKNRLLVFSKRAGWKKKKNIFLSESAIVFPETEISAHTGRISIGDRSCIRGILEVQRENGQISIGEECYVGDHTRIWSAENIRIGNHVLIAHNVNIFDNDTHPVDLYERREDAYQIIWKGARNNFPTLRSKPVEICDDAWIGCSCIILKGVKIGKGAVVAAGSVVTKDVPEFTLVAGNPAKVVKHISVDNGKDKVEVKQHVC